MIFFENQKDEGLGKQCFDYFPNLKDGQLIFKQLQEKKVTSIGNTTTIFKTKKTC